MSALVGTRFGRYEIRSPLGKGGMGEVYLAQDMQLDRTVALKILPEKFASDHRQLWRFVQEAKAASALNHPNIITIHEIGQENSVHFISTEFIDGVTLRHLIADAGMTLREIFDIIIQVASALAAAHAAGIIHRDIKPENIMLRRDGYAKVLDFGLAKLTEKEIEGGPSDPEAPTKPAINTRPGAVMGTVFYMSPEQARGLPVDVRTDIWSFGCVLYEMITGRIPFNGETSSDVIAAILEREPSPLTQHVPKVSAELERIVSKSLAKDTEERYQSVKDLLIDLRRLKRQLEAEAESERALVSGGAGGGQASASQAENAASETDSESLVDTARFKDPHATSSAEYLVSEIKRRKLGAIAVLIVLLAIAAAAVVYIRSSGETPIDSILVLPFRNQSGDAGLNDLSDGITETLINHIAEQKYPRVVTRIRAFSFKEQSEGEALRIGRELSVRAIVLGRIFKRDDALVVKAELFDVDNGSQLWGDEFYESDMIGATSIGPLQEKFSKQILDKLRAKLAAKEQK
jgi:serine/threonine protein kinase